jgi:DNA-binding NarL/FixJ family response regulator
MDFAVSSSRASLFSGAFANSSQGTVAPRKAQTAVAKSDTTDTVHLTTAAQVEQLYETGYPVPQIASRLALSVQAVDQYLNINSK